MNNSVCTVDRSDIDAAATGRCCDIITSLTSIESTSLRKGGTRNNDHPCPLCGHGSFYVDSDVDQHGRVNCHHCDIHTGGVINTVSEFGGCSYHDALSKVAEYLGLWSPNEPAKPKPPIDIIEAVANAKKMPIGAFRLFGPKPATRDGKKVARVPVYDASGKIHSHFDISPNSTDGTLSKGKFKKGEGSSGMFFPGRLPKSGETWFLVEGVKDASALTGLGYDAAGLPGADMPTPFAKQFAGVNVVCVPDLDEPGRIGANKTCGRLKDIAANVKIVRLPGQIKKSSGDDLRDVLHRDGEQAVRDAIEQASEWQPIDEPELADDGRVQLTITANRSRVVWPVIQAIGKLDSNSRSVPIEERQDIDIFQRNGELVDVIGTDIRILARSHVLNRIGDACQLFTEKIRSGEAVKIESPPPDWLADSVISHGRYGEAIRPLERIINAPTMRADGSIVDQPGYDHATGFLYRPEIDYGKISDKPSKQDAYAAGVRLLDVVSDCPFVGDEDRSAWLAFLLTMVARAAIDGNTPLFGFTANAPGCGKGTSVDVASIIALGIAAPVTNYPSRHEELEKVITAEVAVNASPIVVFDNCDTPVGGAALDAVLTAGKWKGRELGRSRTVECEVRTIFAATGNNLRFGSDTGRRVLPIRFASDSENPADRSDFKRDDILGWTYENRPAMLRSALTLLRAHIVAGSPKQSGGEWGSYTAWSRVIRGAIVWAGFVDPNLTRDATTKSDQSRSTLIGLIGGLLEVDESGDGLTAREILNRLDTFGAESGKYKTLTNVIAETMDQPTARKLGNLLSKYKGRVVNGTRLTGKSAGAGFLKWSVEKVGESGESVSMKNESAFRGRLTLKTT